MSIRQNVEVKTAVIEKDQHLEITARKKVNYVHVISGEVMIANHLVKAGDALVFDEIATITALQESQMIWFDLP
jgi:ABC-type Na+ transport system ATPase subunit NatA